MTMEHAALVLEYLKVILRYVLSFPVVILVLALVFRSHIGRALDALLEVSYPGGAAKFRERPRELTQMVRYTDQTKIALATTAAEQRAAHPALQSQEKVVEAIASYFGLAARVLPLIPRAERHQFIQETTASLPNEFSTYRKALDRLAELAPEPRALDANTVIRPETAGLTLQATGTVWPKQDSGAIPPPKL